MPGYTIRPERAADRAAIRELNDAAFGQTSEGELVDALRRGTLESVLGLVESA